MGAILFHEHSPNLCQYKNIKNHSTSAKVRTHRTHLTLDKKSTLFKNYFDVNIFLSINKLAFFLEIFQAVLSLVLECCFIKMPLFLQEFHFNSER